VVRAAVILYFRQAGEEVAKNQRRVREEQRNGFVWIDELVALLEQYERKRAQYPAFASYMPQVAQFYRDLPLRLHLKPNQTYSFVLTPRAFVTTDGYPLVSYTVEFRTK
jgi:Domain of unknown function (DUF4932)